MSVKTSNAKTPPGARHEKIQDFMNELSIFAASAENALSEIEKDPETNRGQFALFSGKMFDIRGTAQQLELENIAHLASLGEEIALKGAESDSRPKIRKCVGALWDALTTVKYLLKHYDAETTEEQEILENRLESVLNSMGGARPVMSEDEITDLLKKSRS